MNARQPQTEPVFACNDNGRLSAGRRPAAPAGIAKAAAALCGGIALDYVAPGTMIILAERPAPGRRSAA